MLDSESWKELAEKFRAIQSPSRTPLFLEWQRTYGARSGLTWKILHDVNHGRTLYLEFMLLAHEAGVGSDKASREPVRTWVEAIIQSDLENNPHSQRDPIPESTHAGEIWHQRGRIHDVCSASVDRCLELQLALVSRPSSSARLSGADTVQLNSSTTQSPNPKQVQRKTQPSSKPKTKSVKLLLPVPPQPNRKRRSAMIESPSAVEKLERYLTKIKNSHGVDLTDFCARENNVSLRTLHNVRRTSKGRPDTFKAIAEAMGTTFEDLMSQ